MKPNVIVALLVGLVLGAVGGRAISGGTTRDSAAATKPAAAAAANAPRPNARPVDPTVFKVPVDGSPTKGSADALVTLVEFSDYQCPFCSRARRDGAAAPEGLRQQAARGDEAEPALLPPARQARRAGRAWPPVSRASTGSSTRSSSPTRRRSRTRTSRSTPRSSAWTWPSGRRTCAKPEFAAIIDRDQALAGKLGASGTPAFFINGRFLSGAQPVDDFKALIDEELAKAEALVTLGHPGQPGVRRHHGEGRGVGSQRSPRSSRRPRPRPYRKVDVPADAPSFGPKDAKVTIVEWSDFECPFCSRVGPTLKQIKETYGKDVRVVFRHQPLPFHQNAKLAAEASMAAHEQGKFWEYHDKLFANQQRAGPRQPREVRRRSSA